MAEGKRGRGCLKIGCLGCLIVVGLPVVVISILFVIGMATGPDEPIWEETAQSHDLPRVGSAELPRGGTELQQLSPQGIPGGGVIRLNTTMMTLRIEPVDADEPLRLEADYDRASYDLEEKFVEEDDGGWVYDLDFDSRLGAIRSMFRTGKVQNDLVLYVPRGVKIKLEGNIGTGESVLELGGLSLTDIDLNVGTGSHRMKFSEPLPEPVESIVVRGGVGEMALTDVGNASPSKLRVDHSIGEFRIDLEGDWRNDAEVYASSSIGETRISLPDGGVKVDLRAGRVSIGETDRRGLTRLERRLEEEPLPEGAPRITLHLSHSIGELRID